MISEKIRKYKKYDINSWFYNLSQLKGSGINSLHLDIDNNTVQVQETNLTITLFPEGYVNLKEVDFPLPHYPHNFIFTDFGSEDIDCEDISYDAQVKQNSHNSQNSEKKLTATAVAVGNDLHILLQQYHKLPSIPPKRDDAIFSRSDRYRTALLQHLSEINDASEFKLFHGASSMNLNSYDSTDNSMNNKFALTFPVKNLPESMSPTQLLALEGQEFEAEFLKVTKSICNHISDLINGDTQEETSKDVSRRKSLRFHVNLYYSLVKLEGYCALNEKFKKGQNPKKSARKLIEKFCTNIPKQKLDLMIKRATRMFLLLNLSNFDWRLMDCFEELTASFFLSAMKSTGNFFIWLNLIRSGVLVDYSQADLFHKNGKEELKQVKSAFLQRDFGDVSLSKLILEDEDC